MTDFNSISDYFNSLSTQEKDTIRKYKKLAVRFSRHKDINCSNGVGRPRKTLEEKIETQKIYRQKKKQERIDNGSYRGRGRPKKIKNEDILT